MQVVDAIGVLVLLCALVLLAVALRRRRLIGARGAVESALRRRPREGGGGWSLGVLRFAGDRLEWHRLLSLSPRPRDVMLRSEVRVTRRRTARPAEHMATTVGGAVVELALRDAVVELALAPQAVAGLLAWLEAAPPGVPRALAG